MNVLAKLLGNRVLILDGATGTNLLGKGIKPGESPSVLNLRNPEAVYRLQRSYINAGSDAVLTNTFSANPLNLKSNEVGKVIKAGINIARRSAGKKLVFGDVGPLGLLIKPYGDNDFSEIKKIYMSLFRYFHQSNCSFFCLETFTSIIEAKAALLAAKDFSDNIIVSFSLQENGRTIMGESPESIAITFEGLGASGIGFNCTSPGVLLGAISKIAGVTNLPIMAKPNAGKVVDNGNTIRHTLSDTELADYFDDFVKAGASIIGGCCGTTAEYIKRIAGRAKKPSRRMIEKRFLLASPVKMMQVGNADCYIVGERLNPSGRKKVKEQLLAHDYAIYGSEASAQEKAGAAALDVNVFVAGLDEKQILKDCVYEILKSSNLPLFIDTQNIDAAKEVLEIYPGVGVYNAIPAREKELKKWLPLIKYYGFKTVISLVGKTIPKSRGERMRNARLAIKIAKQLRFPTEDMIFDPLVFAAATESRQISETLETVTALHDLGLKTILGISNVSFGLPDRSMLNATFAAAAIQAGATFLIANPLDTAIVDTIRAARALFRQKTIDYIQQFRTGLVAPEEKYAKSKDQLRSEKNNSLVQAVVSGNVALCRKLSHDYLYARKLTPHELIEKHIARGMKIVGSDYEKGRLFIPDLLKSAESARAALEIVKKNMKHCEKRGKIILATVKGDIHDIGKNVAAMIFEAGGYEIKDLGKNVAAGKIVNAVRKYRPDAVGLSALLTTTMPEMENVIKALRKAGLKTVVIIGGPNVSESYAKKIGAYGAARNVMEGLRIINRMRRTS